MEGGGGGDERDYRMGRGGWRLMRQSIRLMDNVCERAHTSHVGDRNRIHALQLHQTCLPQETTISRVLQLIMIYLHSRDFATELRPDETDVSISNGGGEMM
jgi:hypothetical protein